MPGRINKWTRLSWRRLLAVSLAMGVITLLMPYAPAIPVHWQDMAFAVVVFVVSYILVMKSMSLQYHRLLASLIMALLLTPFVLATVVVTLSVFSVIAARVGPLFGANHYVREVAYGYQIVAYALAYALDACITLGIWYRFRPKKPAKAKRAHAHS